MYKNRNDDQGGLRRDVGFSCLSWRAQNRGDENYDDRCGPQPSWRDGQPGRTPNHPVESSQPKSLLDFNNGMPLDNRQQMEPAGNGIPREASHPKSLMASIDKKIGPQGDSRQPNAADEPTCNFDESRLSWRSGAPNMAPHPRSLLDEPTCNLDESLLSWRAGQSDGPARNLDESQLGWRGSQPDEPSHKLDESQLSWRAAQSGGPPNNSFTQPRSLLDGPPRNHDEPRLGRCAPQPVAGNLDESRLSWRASQSGPPNNPSTEPYPRSLVDEPHNFDESQLGGRAPPQGPPNNSSTEPRPLLDEPARNRNELRQDWHGAQPDEPSRNLDDSQLSWRAGQSDVTKSSSMEPRPRSLLDEPAHNFDESTLSWRAAQSGEQHGNHPDSRPNWHAPNPDGQYRAPTEPHPRSLQDGRSQNSDESRMRWCESGAPDMRHSENRPRSLLGAGNRTPESHPKSLLEGDNCEGRQLSWRDSQSSANGISPAVAGQHSGHIEDGRVGNLWNRENHDSSYRDMDNTGGLSWRSTNSGTNNTNLPKPLLPGEGAGGSLLGKTKYSDMYPGEKLGMQRDTFGDRFRPAGYASNSYY